MINCFTETKLIYIIWIGGDFEMALIYNKLRGKIVEKFGTQGDFAEFLHVSEVTVSKKLNGKVQFDQDDIISWCDALDIPILEAGNYFFA